MVRVVPRKFESVVGGALINFGKNKAVKDANLIPKTIFLPKCGIPLHYFEREPVIEGKTEEPCQTLLFCHGMSDEAINLAGFIHLLNIPEHIRILVPDAIGHGRDLQRAKTQPDSFKLPTPIDLLESTTEFLDVLKVTNCNAMGYSMGGALVYFVRYIRPDLINKSVLVCPALESVVDPQFIDDFTTGKKRHFCFKNRQDVKLLLRDCCPPQRNKKDPIPKFFLQSIWDERQRTAPSSHFDNMLSLILEHRQDSQISEDDNDHVKQNHKYLSATTDIDPASPRLVFWADHDFICSYNKGKEFFNNALSQSTEIVTIPDCGHMFDVDGTFLLEKVKDEICTYLL